MWQGIIGHDDTVSYFRQVLMARRLATTYLFVGTPGIGKRRFALELARSLLCTESYEFSLAPCGKCESCRLFAAGNHPDLELVALPPDKSTLPIELFIGDREHRNQEGMCHNLAMKPFFGRRKVAIVDDADHFGIASANCLLKTLEEPPPSALLILIGTSPSRQLPTIRSRSQVVRFNPLPEEAVVDILLATGAMTDRELAHRVASLSEGSVERATKLADSALWEFRDQLYSALRAARPDAVRLTRSIQSFVDEAGKEPATKRDRLRIVVGFAIEFYRARLRETPQGNNLSPAVHALDACLTTLEYIDRNANVGLVLQHWCEQLSGKTTSEKTSIRPLALSTH
ncbi:MAG TPA: DNA polymerase III subunit [Lacipirellulaceae bacterium]|jgi:DNA polymerase-3 subunit delta'|nr:DNA polymerase III subunit [Lacipirellulaceae bacterium]